jgi:pyruvate dehydrogenase E1 component
MRCGTTRAARGDFVGRPGGAQALRAQVRPAGKSRQGAEPGSNPRAIAYSAAARSLRSPPMTDQRLPLLAELERRVLWLASWTIHNANHLRDSATGEGRRASGLLRLARHHHDRALFCGAAAAGPGGGEAARLPELPRHPVPRREPDAGEAGGFRGYKGAQSYPSRTKDVDDVDFSTGSVGLGVAQTLFSSLAQDYVTRPRLGPGRAPRAAWCRSIGDAEMDEGNIYRGPDRGLEARPAQHLVGGRLQPPEPRRVVREGLWERFEACSAISAGTS